MALDLSRDALSLATEMVDQFNRRDFDAMLTDGGGRIDYTDVARGVRITDADSFRAAMQGWVTGFSDLRGTVTSAARDGDLLCYEVRWEGTHDGALATPMGELPASGRRLTAMDAFVCRIEGDAIAEVRQYSDTLTLLTQIGAIPAQAGAPAEQQAQATS